MINISTIFNSQLSKIKGQLTQIPKRLICRYFHNKYFRGNTNFDIECNKCKFVFKP
jgi:hypothetical protein